MNHRLAIVECALEGCEVLDVCNYVRIVEIDAHDLKIASEVGAEAPSDRTCRTGDCNFGHRRNYGGRPSRSAPLRMERSRGAARKP